MGQFLCQSHKHLIVNYLIKVPVQRVFVSEHSLFENEQLVYPQRLRRIGQGNANRLIADGQQRNQPHNPKTQGE